MNASAKIKKLERINGELPAMAFPGGYPLFYLDSIDNVLCAACATSQADDSEDYKVRDYDVHWEGEALICDRCNSEIESAYGPLEASENE